MYFPSLDQSFGNLSMPECKILISSCAPSEFFNCRSLKDVLLEAKTNPTPALSGQQAFVGGPKYRPLDLRLVLNIVQNSCWFPDQSEALHIESLGEQSLVSVKQ